MSTMYNGNDEMNENLNLTINVNTEALDALSAKLELAEERLKSSEEEAQRWKNSFHNLAQESSAEIDALRSEIESITTGDEWQRMAEDAVRGTELARQCYKDLMVFIRANGLQDILDNGDWKLNTLVEQVENGEKSIGQAISEIKLEFRGLLESGRELSSGIDLSFLQNVVASIERMSDAISTLEAKIDSIINNGVRTLGDVGGGDTSNFAETLRQVSEASHTAGDGAETAYQPIINLVNAVGAYNDIDTEKIQAISSAFRNLASATSNNLGDKTTNNIIKLLTDLRAATNGEPVTIAFNVKGIEDLKVRKTSLSNLAEYLPTIAKVNVNKLKELSNVDFTNFNNLKVSKGAVEEISKIANAVQILKEAKAASVSVGDKGIGINESAKQAAKGYADYVKEHMRQEAEFQKQVNQDILQSNKQRAAEEINFSKQVTQQKKADQQSYNAYVKQHMQEEAQFEKDLTQAKKADQKSYNAYVKQQTQGEAAFQKQLAQEQSVTEKQRITYLKRATTLLNQMQQAEQNWTKAGATGSKSGGAYQGIKDGVVQLNKCLEDLNNKKITLDEFNQKVNELGLSFKVNSAEIRAAGENTQTFTDRIGKLSSKFGAWLSITRIIMGVIRTIKQMVKAVVEIDSAMTQLQIVTKATNDQMAKFGETAANTAKQIGSTITDFTSSVTTFARLGLT